MLLAVSERAGLGLMNGQLTQYGLRVYRTLREAEVEGFRFYDNPPGEDYYIVRREDRKRGKIMLAHALKNCRYAGGV